MTFIEWWKKYRKAQLRKGTGGVGMSAHDGSHEAVALDAWMAAVNAYRDAQSKWFAEQLIKVSR